MPSPATDQAPSSTATDQAPTSTGLHSQGRLLAAQAQQEAAHNSLSTQPASNLLSPQDTPQGSPQPGPRQLRGRPAACGCQGTQEKLGHGWPVRGGSLGWTQATFPQSAHAAVRPTTGGHLTPPAVHWSGPPPGSGSKKGQGLLHFFKTCPLHSHSMLPRLLSTLFRAFFHSHFSNRNPERWTEP